MQKLLFVTKDDIDEVNEMLNTGWEVKSISPVAEYVSTGSCSAVSGEVYAYIVLEKK